MTDWVDFPSVNSEQFVLGDRRHDLLVCNSCGSGAKSDR